MEKSPPLGCFTASGLIGTVLTLLIVSGLFFINQGILFSPGELNAQSGSPLGGVPSHAATGGQCNLCHVPFWSTASMSSRCIACHTDVAAQWQDPTSLHGALGLTNSLLACRTCHPDHRGATASLTIVDHNLFTFKLTGAHVNVSCTSCHINNVYKGTPADCNSCHAKQDAHSGQFGTNCGSCHSTSAWKPASFDHSSSGFPLTGKHASLTCAQCHTGKVYTKLSTDCVTCHPEPSVHAGEFGTNCVQCHTTSNWNATFNHPGGCDGNCANHRGATCADCHPVNYSTAVCTKCHDSNNPGSDRNGGGG